MTDTQKPNGQLPATTAESTEKTEAAAPAPQKEQTSQQSPAAPSSDLSPQKNETTPAGKANTTSGATASIAPATMQAQHKEQKSGTPRNRNSAGTNGTARKNTTPQRNKSKTAVSQAAGSQKTPLTATPTSNPVAGTTTVSSQTHQAAQTTKQEPALHTESEKTPCVSRDRTDMAERPSEKELPGAIPDSPAMREILEHGQRVATYTDILFKELDSLHGLPPEWGRRLHLAACLHDLGWLEGRKGHHKTSMRIIDEDLSLPITDEDRPWVALLARYHRKAAPSRKHPRFALLQRSQQEMLCKAAALLRLADALDYSHRGVIHHFDVKIGKNKILLQATCTGDCAKEIDRCKEKGTLFARMFKKEPKLVCLPQ